MTHTYGIKVLPARRQGEALSPPSFALACQNRMGIEKERERDRGTLGRQMPRGQRRAFTEAERRRQCMWATIQKPICCWNGACDGGSHAVVRPSVRCVPSSFPPLPPRRRVLSVAGPGNAGFLFRGQLCRNLTDSRNVCPLIRCYFSPGWRFSVGLRACSDYRSRTISGRLRTVSCRERTRNWRQKGLSL